MIEDSQLVPRLLESGAIDQATLKEGIKIGQEANISLYEAISTHKLMDERKLVRIVSKLIKVPCVELGRLTIGPEILGLIPSSMAVRNLVVPIQVRNEGGSRQLVLGMADPIDVTAMDEISTHTGVDIRPVLVGRDELNDFLEQNYGASNSDSAVEDLLDDLDSLTADLIDDDGSWAEFFDDAQALDFTDTASISQEMRDRPGTDVLDELNDESDFASLDDLEDLEDLNDPSHPISEPIADLEEWDLDDAITGTHEEVDPLTSPSQRAQILSVDDANSLFADEPEGTQANVDAIPEVKEVEEEAEEEDEDGLDEPTQLKTPSELAEASEAEEESKTSVGLGVKELAANNAGSMSVEQKSKSGRPSNTKTDQFSTIDAEESEAIDNTGHTRAGMGVGEVSSDKEIEAPKKTSKDKKFKRLKSESTDYGALGRQILAPGAEEEEEEEGAEEKAAESDDDTNRVKDKTEEAVVPPKKIKPEPLPDEDDDFSLAPPEAELPIDPLTRSVPDASELDDENNKTLIPTQLPFDPQTREIGELDLLQALHHEPSGLSENTAAAELEEQRLLIADSSGHSREGKSRHTRETTKNKAISRAEARGSTQVGAPSMLAEVMSEEEFKREDTRPRTVDALVDEVKLDIPNGVSDRDLLVAALKLLVAQGLLNADALLELAAKESADD